MVEDDVIIASGNVALSGTWTCPADARAMVVFVHGSGPLDRNQNSAHAELNIFNVIADELAKAGVASLRYDKRGIGRSTGEYMSAGQADFAADLRAAITYARTRADLPLVLCGHSEGTALAVMMAEHVDGFVLLCPYVTNGADILRQQAVGRQKEIGQVTGIAGLMLRLQMRITGGPVRAQEKRIRRILNSDEDVVTIGRQKTPARWFRDFMTMDNAAIHARNARPTLVIVAARDAQCPPTDGARIVAMNPRAELLILDDLSHLLRHTTVDGLGDYGRQLQNPIDPRVARALCDWISATVN